MTKPSKDVLQAGFLLPEVTVNAVEYHTNMNL